MQTHCNLRIAPSCTAQYYFNDESRLYRFGISWSTKTLQNENKNIVSGTCVLHSSLIG